MTPEESEESGGVRDGCSETTAGIHQDRTSKLLLSGGPFLQALGVYDEWQSRCDRLLNIVTGKNEVLKDCTVSETFWTVEELSTNRCMDLVGREEVV